MIIPILMALGGPSYGDALASGYYAFTTQYGSTRLGQQWSIRAGRPYIFLHPHLSLKFALHRSYPNLIIQYHVNHPHRCLILGPTENQPMVRRNASPVPITGGNHGCRMHWGSTRRFLALSRRTPHRSIAPNNRLHLQAPSRTALGVRSRGAHSTGPAGRLPQSPTQTPTTMRDSHSSRLCIFPLLRLMLSYRTPHPTLEAQRVLVGRCSHHGQTRRTSGLLLSLASLIMCTIISRTVSCPTV